MDPTTRTRSRLQPLAAAVLFAVSFMVAVFAVTTPHFNAPDAAWTGFRALRQSANGWQAECHRACRDAQKVSP